MSFLFLLCTLYKMWFLLSELEIETRCEMHFTCLGLGASRSTGKMGRARCQRCCFWGSCSCMGCTSLIQVSENFCFLPRHLAHLLSQETQLLLTHCLPEALSHCILKWQSVSIPFSVPVSHEFFSPIKSQLYLGFLGGKKSFVQGTEKGKETDWRF